MKNKYIVSILWIGIVILLIYLFSINREVSTNTSQVSDTSIEQFNTILENAVFQEDIEKCDELPEWDLQENCKSQLQDRFSPEYSATEVSQCINDEDIVWQDICILNVAIKKSNSDNAISDCSSIQTEDIKQSCFAQVQPTNE